MPEISGIESINLVSPNLLGQQASHLAETINSEIFLNMFNEEYSMLSQSKESKTVENSSEKSEGQSSSTEENLAENEKEVEEKIIMCDLSTPLQIVENNVVQEESETYQDSAIAEQKNIEPNVQELISVKEPVENRDNEEGLINKVPVMQFDRKVQGYHGDFNDSILQEEKTIIENDSSIDQLLTNSNNFKTTNNLFKTDSKGLRFSDINLSNNKKDSSIDITQATIYSNSENLDIDDSSSRGVFQTNQTELKDKLMLSDLEQVKNSDIESMVTEENDLKPELEKQTVRLNTKETPTKTTLTEIKLADSSSFSNMLEKSPVNHPIQIDKAQEVPVSATTFKHNNIKQIVTSIEHEVNTLTNQDMKTFKLTLKPESLGELDVVLDVKEGKVSAKFIVETDKVKDLIQNNLSSLQETLGKSNIVLSKSEVLLNTSNNSFSSFGGSMEQRQQQQQGRSFNADKFSQQYKSKDEYEETNPNALLDSVNILV